MWNFKLPFSGNYPFHRNTVESATRFPFHTSKKDDSHPGKHVNYPNRTCSSHSKQPIEIGPVKLSHWLCLIGYTHLGKAVVIIVVVVAMTKKAPRQPTHACAQAFIFREVEPIVLDEENKIKLNKYASTVRAGDRVSSYLNRRYLRDCAVVVEWYAGGESITPSLDRCRRRGWPHNIKRHNWVF